MGFPWIARRKTPNLFKSVGITQSADKYTWPPIQPVIYNDGIELRQVSDRVFMLIGLTEVQTRHKDFLLKQLKRTAPVDTGRLKRSYDAFPLEYQRGQWAIVFNNRMVYFKFPFHYYLKRGRNFIQDAVDPVVKKMGKKPAKIPTAKLLPKAVKLPKGIIGKTEIKKEIKDIRLPKLAKGKKYGAAMKVTDLRVGDRFQFIGDRATGSTGGKIVKVNRKTVEYESGKTTIQTRKEDVFKPGLTYITKGSSPNIVRPIE